MRTIPWAEPDVVQWSQRLLDSYYHWMKKDLIERTGDAKQQAGTLFGVSFVVVSHGMELDPLLNYGNQMALDLWEVPWERFLKMPSRLTVEPDMRAEREQVLRQAKADGYFDGYQGVRISSTGKRFLIEQALIWTVVDSAARPVGQAATFSLWSRVS
jgi:hypothetical protein